MDTSEHVKVHGTEPDHLSRFNFADWATFFCVDRWVISIEVRSGSLRYDSIREINPKFEIIPDVLLIR